MANRTVKNTAASVRARLLNLSKKTGENYNAVLLRFFQERFLARLGASAYGEHFVLKGGLLLLARHVTPFRPTVDIDMLGISISNNPERLSAAIRAIAEIELNDGVQFETDSIAFQTIKEGADYEGLRFVFSAHLGTIKSQMRLDVGFGDKIPLAFMKGVLPTMLPDFSAPELLLYPLESVIAEKFQAIVYLGLATSRMKDFYDIIFLAKNNSFTLGKLKAAIEATFNSRKTDINSRFFVYGQEYIFEKEELWKSFLRKIESEERENFSQTIGAMKAFLEPAIKAEENEGHLIWNPETWQWTE